MTIERRISRLFRLDREGWARHANPWSGWSRLTCLPLLALAIWSRAWLGGWSLGPVVVALAWVWLDPRAFPPVGDDGAWISRGVFGERFWSDRHARPVPPRHRRLPHLLTSPRSRACRSSRGGSSRLIPGPWRWASCS